MTKINGIFQRESEKNKGADRISTPFKKNYEINFSSANLNAF